MHRISILASCGAALVLGATNTQAAMWSASSPATSSCSSTNLFASWSYGSYTFNNNVWSPCSNVAAGAQTIWANTNGDWGVTSDQPNTSGIKSYPHIGYSVNKTISSLSRLTAAVSATTPAGGAWESTFDIWTDDKAHEIMVWLNYTGTSAGCGNVKPISYNWTSDGCAIPHHSNVSLSGGTWNVYVGTNGRNMVYSFLRTDKTNNTTIDVLAIMKYLKSLNYFHDVMIGDLQYGFEITSSSGGLNFASKDFVVAAE
ncbi:GH12 family glycosyl hydrolase domain-containing protein [Cupriavidus consociatus]|uniref:GH12 family glycosyl hydrolase domain-containing protein n=1 Tax=Cupriavidus consociatus TaxID=2821357 RepID=UPI001AE80DE2|nr:MULTISPECIES: glycosyl hydrolase [unclassified Cupriavidus]MBP0625337.1 glycosyl hydrolase [Cupriavidus sp. LEh25]MDK2662073.1 glycosyl hydrolase [Cupriavidus sp. LEh21]